MTELPDHIYEEVERLSEKGNELLEDKRDAAGAMRLWQQALALLPEPKQQWEAALWLNSSLGEAARTLGQLERAKQYFYDALNCPDGHMNPFVHLRLGQTLIGLGEQKAGVDHLLRAYMLDGDEVFEEDPDALAILKKSGLID